MSNLVNANATLTLADLVANQQSASSAAAFVAYNSKKTLLAANSVFAANINAKCMAQLTALKNCFAFAAHVSHNYLVITMYYNASKSYSFYVLSTATLAVQSFTSIKTAKAAVITAVAAEATADAAKAATVVAAALTTPVKPAVAAPVVAPAKPTAK